LYKKPHDDYERVPSIRRRSRPDRQNDRDWLDVDLQSQPNELSRRDREQAKQGRKVSDFQTIEVNGKLAISVEDLIAAGVIFRE
jgi:hypothetical protein